MKHRPGRKRPRLRDCNINSAPDATSLDLENCLIKAAPDADIVFNSASDVNSIDLNSAPNIGILVTEHKFEVQITDAVIHTEAISDFAAAAKVNYKKKNINATKQNLSIASYIAARERLISTAKIDLDIPANKNFSTNQILTAKTSMFE